MAFLPKARQKFYISSETGWVVVIDRQNTWKPRSWKSCIVCIAV